jgi:DNA-directed RNA polymerase III subunit RPC8
MASFQQSFPNKAILNIRLFWKKQEMFYLVLLKETVRVTPDLFDREEDEILSHLLEEKYCNRVIHDIGLGLAVWSIKEVGDRIIYPGDGAAHIDGKMKLVIY